MLLSLFSVVWAVRALTGLVLLRMMVRVCGVTGVGGVIDDASIGVCMDDVGVCVVVYDDGVTDRYVDVVVVGVGGVVVGDV